jgi:hypothetical protein
MRRERTEYSLADVPTARKATKSVVARQHPVRIAADPDLAAVLEAAIRHCADAAARKSVTVARRCLASQRIGADPLVLFAVIEGLVANAIARTAAGGIVVCAIQQLKGEIVVSVADGGALLHGADLARMLWPHAEPTGSMGDGSARCLDEVWLGVASQLHGARIEGRNRGDGAGAVMSLHIPTKKG